MCDSGLSQRAFFSFPLLCLLCAVEKGHILLSGQSDGRMALYKCTMLAFFLHQENCDQRWWKSMKSKLSIVLEHVKAWSVLLAKKGVQMIVPQMQPDSSKNCCSPLRNLPPWKNVLWILSSKEFKRRRNLNFSMFKNASIAWYSVCEWLKA